MFLPDEPILPSLSALKEPALAVGNGEAEEGHDMQDVLPEFAFFGEAGISEEVGWVEGGHDGDAVEFAKRSAVAGDGARFGEEAFHGAAAEGDDDFRLHDFDFADQVRASGVGFRRVRLAILFPLVAAGNDRAELEDVGNVDVAAFEPHGVDYFVEQLAGGTDERLALAFLLGSRRFTDEHQRRMRIADCEHHDVAQGAGFDEFR